MVDWYGLFTIVNWYGAVVWYGHYGKVDLKEEFFGGRARACVVQGCQEDGSYWWPAGNTSYPCTLRNLQSSHQIRN